MLLAQFEAYYSRAFVPTRRISLGHMQLPVDPAPGFGGVLLGGIMARYCPQLDDDLDDDLDRLLDELEAGYRIGQPRFRHRLQDDQVGLHRCRHRLIGDGDALSFVFDDAAGSPAQHVVCAAYAAAAVPIESRAGVFAAVRKGMGWFGTTDVALAAHLLDRRAGALTGFGDPVAWALDLLDLSAADGARVLRREVMRAYRDRLIDVHPDHGGDSSTAAEQIAALGEARRILLGA